MKRDARGQVLAFYAVLVPVILLPLMAYAVDAAFVTARGAGLRAATDHAAEAAAQQLDVAAFRSRSVLTVDRLAARAAAAGAIGGSEPGATLESVVIAGPVVTISTREEITLPFTFLPAQAIVIRAQATARLVGGYDSPSSLLPLPTRIF